MIDLHRISKEKYSKLPLEASGRTNRWNKVNEYVLYFSDSLSTAMVENLAYRNNIKSKAAYDRIKLIVDPSLITIKEIQLSSLPKNWRDISSYAITQQIGSDWYQKKESIILKVPSALIPEQFNYVVNTNHPDFIKLKNIMIDKFEWDQRLL